MYGSGQPNKEVIKTSDIFGFAVIGVKQIIFRWSVWRRRT